MFNHWIVTFSVGLYLTDELNRSVGHLNVPINTECTDILCIYHGRHFVTQRLFCFVISLFSSSLFTCVYVSQCVSGESNSILRWLAIHHSHIYYKITQRKVITIKTITITIIIKSTNNQNNNKIYIAKPNSSFINVFFVCFLSLWPIYRMQSNEPNRNKYHSLGLTFHNRCWYVDKTHNFNGWEWKIEKVNVSEYTIPYCMLLCIMLHLFMVFTRGCVWYACVPPKKSQWTNARLCSRFDSSWFENDCSGNCFGPSSSPKSVWFRCVKWWKFSRHWNRALIKRQRVQHAYDSTPSEEWKQSINGACFGELFNWLLKCDRESFSTKFTCNSPVNHLANVKPSFQCRSNNFRETQTVDDGKWKWTFVCWVCFCFFLLPKTSHIWQTMFEKKFNSNWSAMHTCGSGYTFFSSLAFWYHIFSILFTLPTNIYHACACIGMYVRVCVCVVCRIQHKTWPQVR